MPRPTLKSEFERGRNIGEGYVGVRDLDNPHFQRGLEAGMKQGNASFHEMERRHLKTLQEQDAEFMAEISRQQVALREHFEKEGILRAQVQSFSDDLRKADLLAAKMAARTAAQSITIRELACQIAELAK